MMHHAVKLHGAPLHARRIKWPLHVRPQQAQLALAQHPHRRRLHSRGRQRELRRVLETAIDQRAAHFGPRFSSTCRLRSAVSTDVSTTFSPTYTRSTPASEITSDPWITTPAFKTWSRISSRETSSSPPPISSTDSKSVGIRDKRVRRPRPIYFDAPLPFPPLHKILQYLVPLFPLRARDQESRLPKQVGLRSAYLPAGRGIDCNLFQRRRQLAQLLIAALRAFLQACRLLLQVLFPGPRLAHGDRRCRTLRKNLHAPLFSARDAGKNLVQRGLSSQHVFYQRRFAGKNRAKPGWHNRHLRCHFPHHLLVAHAVHGQPL